MRAFILLFPLMLSAPQPVWMFRSFVETVTARTAGVNTRIIEKMSLISGECAGFQGRCKSEMLK